MQELRPPDKRNAGYTEGAVTIYFPPAVTLVAVLRKSF